MIGSNHFHLSIKTTSISLLKVPLRYISCIIIKWLCSCIQMAAKSIFTEQLLIIKKSVTGNPSIQISVVKLLPITLCLHEILLMIYYHHCNRLNQVVPLNEIFLIYSNSCQWHIIYFILIYLIHTCYSYEIFKVLLPIDSKY